MKSVRLLEKLPLGLCTAWLSAQAQCIFFFNAMGLILPFMTNLPGDHPSFDNLEMTVLGGRVEGGIERERRLN